MNYLYRIHIGLGRSHAQDYEGQLALIRNSQTRQELIKQFGGCGQILCDGGWKSPTGALYSEPSVIFEVISNVSINDGLEKYIKDVLVPRYQQEAIYLFKIEGFAKLIS